MTKTIIHWEDKLTHLSSLLLLIGTAYGITAGAVVTMYYGIVPDMASLEDKLGVPLFGLYLLSIAAGLIHLPFAVSDVVGRRWKLASMRAIALAGPLIVFLGADGLLAHFLWWGPLSDTDRFHLLHHSVFAGMPLAFGYWLALRWQWRPALLTETPPLSRTVAVVSGIVLLLGVAVGGTLVMGLSPGTGALLAVVGILAFVVLSRITR